MLSFHLYQHSQFNASIAQDKRTIVVEKKNEHQAHQGPQAVKTEDKATFDEDVIMIPVEDVTIITFKSEIKKGLQADIKSQIIPTYEDSNNCCDRCYARLTDCCGKIRDACCCYRKKTKVASLVLNTALFLHNEDPDRMISYQEEPLTLPKEKNNCCTSFCDRFRCWCCRKKILVGLTKRTDTKAERTAERVITMKIEYSKYSNLNSASNARLLSGPEQFAYYKNRFDPDIPLEFYLVHNKEFDSRNFERSREEAEALCRIVMQLKGMINYYPSEQQLEQILGQSHKRAFGELYDEPIMQLPSNPTTTRGGKLQGQSFQRSAVHSQRVITSGFQKAKKIVVDEDTVTEDDDIFAFIF